MATLPEQVDGKSIDSTSFAHHLMPVRGILSTHNARGMAFDLDALKKWVALNGTLFHALKMDVRLSAEAAPMFGELLDYARHKQVRLSLRTTGEIGLESLESWRVAGLLDVLLVLRAPDMELLARWAAVCAAAGLPLRVQLCAPFARPVDVSGLADALKGAVAVHVALFDHFDWNPPKRCRRPIDARDQINALVSALRERGVEINVLHMPPEHLQPENHPHLIQHDGFYRDHQLYMKGAHELAAQIHRLGPVRMEKALENLLSRRTSVHNAIDGALLPWILEDSWRFGRVWILHKLTRHLPYFRHQARALSGTEQFYFGDVQVRRLKRKQSGGPVEVSCRRALSADHEAVNFRRLFPGVQPLKTGATDHVSSASDVRRHRHYDEIDEVRRQLPARHAALAEEARRILLYEKPTREVSADDYDVQDRIAEHMPGALRWHAYTNLQLVSTELPTLETPFTMSVVFGGGMAGQVGFCFGRHAHVVCPMLEYSHEITLHADADGHYVLLRDGVLIQPTEYEGVSVVPPRLGTRVTPRIMVHNLDGLLLTQGLRYWEHGKISHAESPEVKYSVVVINTRFSRRLQIMLQALAHQQDFDLSRLEVAVGYVPGIDNTDDVIDTLRVAYPGLRIVRSPFAERYVRSKGFMINKTVPLTTGEWVVLLDADIVVPPDFFAKLELVEQGTHFIAPEGRRMLSAETTARILLGHEHPWEQFEAMAAQAPEYRQRESGGIPIGFCQCVRRGHFRQVEYRELDHFESADYDFGFKVVQQFGKELRMEDTDVLHLDHGGSQWYGTKKQM